MVDFYFSMILKLDVSLFSGQKLELTILTLEHAK